MRSIRSAATFFTLTLMLGSIAGCTSARQANDPAASQILIQTSFVARIASIAYTREFDGKVYFTNDIDTWFVITLEVIKGGDGLALHEDGTVSFAIHSPSMMFGRDRAIGSVHDFGFELWSDSGGKGELRVLR